MWRFFLKATIIGLIGLIIVAWGLKDSYVSSYLTKKLQVPVSIGSIGIWPTQANIYNFKIKNPKGYKHKEALRVRDISILYDMKNLFSDPIVIDEIYLDGVDLNIELTNLTGSRNNWTEIGENMPEQKSNRHIIINKLVLQNMTVDVSGGASGLSNVAGKRYFDRMEFKNIDSRQGFPTKLLVDQIFKGAGLNQYIQDFIKTGKTIQKTMKNPWNILGENENAPDKND